MEYCPSHKKGMVIAIAGKGGAGKTALTAMMIKILRDEGRLKILVIDADPAIGLSNALGVKVNNTIANISDRLRREPGFRKGISSLHIKDVIGETVQHERGFQILAMGHDEGPGCYCGINELLKYGIASLSGEADLTLIDCEAGIEQIKRRVLCKVNFLIGITDMSARGLHLVNILWGMVHGNGETTQQCDKGLVVNRVIHGTEAVLQIAKQSNLRLIGCIPEDENIFENDLIGKPLLDLPDNSPAIIATRTILKDIGPIFDRNKRLHKAI